MIIVPHLFSCPILFIKITIGRKSHKSATWSCVRNYFYFVLWSKLAGRSAQTYERSFFFSISSRFGQFPEIFGQVKEWFMLELHGIIVPHVVACLMDFNLFSDRVQQPGVLKPTKNDHFQIFLTVWVLFLKFSGRLRSGIYWNCMKW